MDTDFNLIVVGVQNPFVNFTMNCILNVTFTLPETDLNPVLNELPNSTKLDFKEN